MYWDWEPLWWIKCVASDSKGHAPKWLLSTLETILKLDDSCGSIYFSRFLSLPRVLNNRFGYCHATRLVHNLNTYSFTPFISQHHIPWDPKVFIEEINLIHFYVHSQSRIIYIWTPMLLLLPTPAFHCALRPKLQRQRLCWNKRTFMNSLSSITTKKIKASISKAQEHRSYPQTVLDSTMKMFDTQQ